MNTLNSVSKNSGAKHSFSLASPRKTYWYQDFFCFLPFSMFLNQI
jgi:hypothetical protein